MLEIGDQIKWTCYDTSPPILLDGKILKVIKDDNDSIYRIRVNINGKIDIRRVREQLLQKDK